MTEVRASGACSYSSSTASQGHPGHERSHPCATTGMLKYLVTCSPIFQMQALIYAFLPLFCYISGSQSLSVDKAIRTAIVLIGIMGRDLEAVQLPILRHKAPRTRLMLMWEGEEGVLLSVPPCPALPTPFQ